jgi:hypothetical protein
VKKTAATVVSSAVMVFLMVLSAQAVTWDVDRPLYSTPSGVYTVPTGSNGGFHYYISETFDNRGSGTSSTDINTPTSNTTTENFGPYPAQMIYQANGGGGVLSNGLFNNAYGKITPDLNANSSVQDAMQGISTDTFRNFVSDGTGTVTVSADIAGTFNWEVYNYDWTKGQPQPFESVPNPFDWYSGYRVKGVVEIFPLSVSGGQVESIDPLILDNDTLSGSIQFDPSTNPDIYYVLHVTLGLETYLSTADPFTGVPLNQLSDKLFQIGNSENDPLKLMVTVEQTPVPIPPAVLLLACGLGGLGFIRHRGARNSDS